MENIIKRTISLEPIKTRLNMYGECINDGFYTQLSQIPNKTNGIWGKIPYDAVLDDAYSQYINIPKTQGLKYENDKYTEISKSKNTVRYSNFLQLLTWFNTFIRGTKFYRMGKKTNGTSWTDISTNFNFLESNVPIVILPLLPLDDSDGVCRDIFGNEYICGDGTIVGINEQYDVFYKTFRLPTNNILTVVAIDDKKYKKICPDNERGEKLFLKFKEKYQTGNILKSIPYFDLPIYIETDIDSLGQYETVEEEWNENNIYHDSDIVSYNGESYKLKCNDNSTIDNVYLYGELIDAIESVKEDSDKWVATYKSSNELITNANVWEKYNEIISNDSEIDGVITESRLTTLKRSKNSVDDEGNSLPFIVGEDEEGNLKTEIPFIIGCANLYADTDEADCYYIDIIEEITFLDENGNLLKKYNCYNSEESNDIQTITINFDDIESFSKGTISIKYILGNRAKFNDKNIMFTLDKEYGVQYEEEYPFEIKNSEPILYDGRTRVFKYIDIKYNDVSSLNENESLENGIESIILSNVKYKNKEKIEYNNFPIIKNESTIGMEDVTKDINIYVERGASALFERMNILSEINTFQDLNNYRNNMFEL